MRHKESYFILPRGVFFLQAFPAWLSTFGPAIYRDKYIHLVFCSTALTSTGWVQMTIKPCTVHHLSSAAVIKSQQHRIFLVNILEQWESHPGRLGVERECYHCAMPSPPKPIFLLQCNHFRLPLSIIQSFKFILCYIIVC